MYIFNNILDIFIILGVSPYTSIYNAVGLTTRPYYSTFSRTFSTTPYYSLDSNEESSNQARSESNANKPYIFTGRKILPLRPSLNIQDNKELRENKSNDKEFRENKSNDIEFRENKRVKVECECEDCQDKTKLESSDVKVESSQAKLKSSAVNVHSSEGENCPHDDE